MGGCGMDPYDMLVEEYGSDAVQQYFVMRAVRKHAFSEKIRLMNRLAEQASSFKKGAVDVIEHKMKRVHGEYLTVLNDMEKQREGTRHMLEAHFRENIQELLGKRETDQHFAVLLKTANQNALKSIEQTKNNCQVQFEKIKQSVFESIPSLPKANQQSEPVSKQCTKRGEHMHKDRIAKQIKVLDRRIGSAMTISERLSDYSTIIPQMELDSLANTAKRKFEASRDAALARMQFEVKRSCW